jgi:lipopolysaccharide transport system permease protein
MTTSATKETKPVDIEPPRRRIGIEVRPLWEFRSLLYFFTWRDLKVRYKQTLLGASWAILQPLLTTVVFAVFLGHVAHVKSQGVPYLIFAFTGMLPWTYFSSGVTIGSASLVSSANIITKVYFPRITMPIASVLGCGVDFLCAAIVLVPMMAWFGIAPSLRLLALPLFFLLATVCTLGLTLFLAALNVRYRDVKYVIPFMVQLLLFASPVVYSAVSLNRPWRVLYALNPMVGVIDGFRWSILGLAPAPGVATVLSLVSGTAILLMGAAYLRAVDQSMPDVI